MELPSQQKQADVCIESQTVGTDWAPNAQILNSATSDKDTNSFTNDGRKSKLKSPAHEDLSDGDRISATRNEMVTSEPVENDWNLSQTNEETLRNKMDKIISQSCQSYKKKDKEKVLSDAHVMERMSKVEEESHASIGSCNRKSAKKHEDSSPSTSSMRQESSFMNWISNMLKGSPDHAEEKQEQRLIMCMENQTSECKMGFRAIFQSLYSPNTTTAQDARALSVQYQMEEVSHDLMGKTNSAEKRDINFVLHGRSICDIGDKSFNPKSLWVSKYSSKESSSVLKIDHHSHGEDKFHESLTDCNDILGDVGKESNCDTTKTALSLKCFKRLDSGKSIDKVIPNFPSPSLKSSRAFCSFFTRRLDLLKHIIQLNEMNDPSGTAGICLFCGRRGHDLQDCAEITESEVKHLLRNIHAYNWSDESLGLCIKCFQHNHWGIACPNVSSRSQQSEGDNAHFTKEKENNLTSIEKKRSVQLFGEDVYCSSPRRDTDFSFNHKTCGVILDNKILSNSEYGKCIASNSGKTTIAHNNVNQEISEVPKLTFDAIKKLRLSRTDILKWKNNLHPSRLPLDGFFLRLRVGMLEEGLRGASYYVACISRTGSESASSGSNDTIVVTVGGMQCSVKSQYISNHDFLEDELMSWWCTILQGRGGGIPSEEHLKWKFEEKNKLGL